MSTTAHTQNQTRNTDNWSPLTYTTQVPAERKFKAKEKISDEYIWQNFLVQHRIIHLLRPDYFMIYKFSRGTTLFQRNISLDLGVGEVTLEKIMHYMLPTDMQNIMAIDKAMINMTSERKVQPLDYIYKVCVNIDCPNTSLKRIMRTSILIHNSDTGVPELGFVCYHDVSSMVSSIKPNNYDITFDPDQAYLEVELDAKLKIIRPGKMDITSRERDIVLCLHKGLSSKEIASELFISKATVDTHRQNMLHKWDLPNTAALLKKAVEEGWV